METDTSSAPVELAYTEYGNGSPILILHGLFGSGANWRGLARRLGESHHVYVLDLRNHGRSPWNEKMTYSAMAADVAYFIESHGLGPTDLIGHSMGGKAAMQLALCGRELIRRLVVIDIAPVEYDHSHSALIGAMRGLDTGALRSRGDADRALRGAVPEDGVRQFLLQNLLLTQDRWSWRINIPVLEKSMRDLAGFPAHGEDCAFAGKMLLVYGDRSSYVRPEYEDAVRRHFPHARLRAVAGAGHWVHAEQPDAVFEAVRDFLDR